MAGVCPERFPSLPKSITASADALEQDKALADVIGSVMCSHWINTRAGRGRCTTRPAATALATTVTDWELDRYFELI